MKSLEQFEFVKGSALTSSDVTPLDSDDRDVSNSDDPTAPPKFSVQFCIILCH